jgi:DNA-directed RNA polymerase specialized sigma24 family protein
MSDDSVTQWLDRLQEGDPEAAQRLWERYFRRLVGLARARLCAAPRGAADEEDVALSALDSFCRGAEQGRFPRLADRDGLWRLLMTITGRKALRLLRDQGRQKRGGLAPPAGPADPDGEDALEQALSREPTPELAAQVGDECRRLLGLLGDASLESVAVWRMEGYSVAEIAGRLGCAGRSVKRKLELIRGFWEREAQR